jgi:hypothetical protein
MQPVDKKKLISTNPTDNRIALSRVGLVAVSGRSSALGAILATYTFSLTIKYLNILGLNIQQVAVSPELLQCARSHTGE